MSQKKKRLSILWWSLGIFSLTGICVASSVVAVLTHNKYERPQTEGPNPNDNNSDDNTNKLDNKHFVDAKLDLIVYWNDVVFNSQDIEWTNLEAKQPNWDSQKTKTNLEKALLEVGRKAFESSPIKTKVEDVIKNKYMIDEGWNIDFALRGNWYTNIKSLGIWQAFQEKNDGSQNWTIGNWLPDFDLKITNSQYPGFIHTHWFRVNKG